MKMSARLIFCLLLLCSAAAASIRILENSTTRLVFRWELEALDTASVRDSGQMATALSFGDENIMLGSEGDDAIPGVSVFAGMPAAGVVKVNFVPGQVRTLTLNHPLRKNRTEGGRSVLAPQPIQFSEGWLSNPRYTWFKSLRAAHLVIRPFRSDARSRMLQMLMSGECTIEFPPSPARVARPHPAATDYQRMLQRLLLNYGVATSWAKAARPPLGLRKALDPYPFDYSQPLLTFTIGDGHAGMNALTTRENGVLKISGAQIKRLFGSLHISGLDTAAISMRAVALYGSWKGALPATCPGQDSIPAGITEVPLFRYDRTSNGIVDNDDYFLAFVTGLSDWGYDTVRRDFRYSLHDYDDNRHYWLTLRKSGDGAGMVKFAQPPVGRDTVDWFFNRVMFGAPNYRPVKVVNGVPNDEDIVGHFVWQRVSPFNPTFVYRLDLPGLDTAAAGTAHFTMYNDMLGARVMAALGNDTLSPACRNDQDYPVSHWGDHGLRLVYADQNSGDWLQVENLAVRYRRPLAVASDTVRMCVFSSTDEGTTAYRLTRANSTALAIFRIPPDERAITLVDTVPAGAPSASYVWSDTGNLGVRYEICNEAGLLTLPDASFSLPPRRLTSTTGLAISNLREVTNRADYLIVTHPAFLSEAETLAVHKSKHGFARPRIVSTGDIYTDFAGGNTDPVAIRNFLAFAIRNWAQRDSLDYVLFMGNGHYDAKRIQTNVESFIPAYLIGYNCIEDFYASLFPGDFGSANQLSVAIGRIPCQSKSDADAMVAKIIELEDLPAADWGSWRNSILFVADDDMQGSSHDPISGNDYGHHASSDKCALKTALFRPSMDLRKVYLFDYPWNTNYNKPEASRAIVNEVNSGVAYVNFFGHGSDHQWADENILSPAVISQFSNEKRYPMISSFSCSVGMFDRPGMTSLSEALVRTPGAGASAAFASTRGAAATSNEVLALNLYSSLFDSVASPTIGTAILSAKFNNIGPGCLYVLFGDPSFRFVNASRRVRLEVAGARGDTVRALQKIVIRGAILDNSGAVDATFGAASPASVLLGMYNPPEVTGRKDGGEDTTVRWLRPGKPVFSARTAVRNGLFEQTAILPMNIAFDKTGARLTAYAWEGAKAGLGSKPLLFHGTDTSSLGSNDTVGPRITIRPVYDMESMRSNSVSFSDRIVSSLPLKFEIVLDDPSGINVADNGPDEGLTMEMPGTISRRNINYKFQFAEGDFRKGSAILSFEENSLRNGRYSLLVTAQDLRGNVSRAQFALEITDENDLSLDRVFNTPNPMRMGGTTRFFFFPSRTTTQNYYPPLTYVITIKLYSLGGRLLRVLKNARNGEVWDGRDQTGYPLPPNIYLYQVVANDITQDKEVKSKIQKLVIHPPGK